VTLHVSYDHACGGCGAFFIPFAPQESCPRCGRPATETFDFVPQAVASLRFNLETYGQYLPPAWYVGSLGDHCLRLLFMVFDGFRTKDDPAEPFEVYLDRRLAAMGWGEQPYLQVHVRSLALKVRAVMEQVRS